VPFRVPPASSSCASIRRPAPASAPAAPSILEGFKPGTAPPDGYAYADYENSGGGEVRDGRSRTWSVTPDDDRALRRGPGGLY
jgi:penicillin-binding protein 1A